MPDDCSNGTVVHCGICLGIKCWRLQKCCRKDDLMESTVVVRIHGLRFHRPLLPIYRRMKPIDAELPVESRRMLNISDEIVFLNLQSAVIAPLIWIANLNRVLLQLMEGLSLCYWCHPCQ